ncbi:histone deacetylase family protein [Aquibaculum arenosum]|uniref:Histone deacetylase family protein n=1 Tax=Aquibaculum arenosum TaxID=3032591 RepID=A0ABT5YMP6_9PROT|nr:histone deacetylase family protein [Fodinicurvata sp. CAU 1616]MDF2096241.1 histone deacetylase family protein [Fodinicurvata sp. CAU 1616]
MSTVLFTHEACFGHDMGRFHPESPARLKAVLSALEGPAFSSLQRREAPRATREQLERVHPADYVERLLDLIPSDGVVELDDDTSVSPGSGEAALRAAGAVCAAVDAVIAGEADNAFCAVRPPGHHAEPSKAMGFCLFSNVAIGAQQARAVHNLHRIAVIDFDVHHGNGTQAAFWDDPDLLLISLHQSPLYPGTGLRSERGCAENILNIPMAPMANSEAFHSAFSQEAIPRLVSFDPDLIMISAGFDAHEDDPLASLRYLEEDFAWATSELLAVANHACRGRLVSSLEGGYDLDALGRSAAAHVGALLAA